jgi:uncharacterized protein
MSRSMLRVEVAYARPGFQALRSVELPEGSCVADALKQSGLALEFPEIGLAGGEFAVYGRRVAPGTMLHDHDRVEILRPLAADPKEVRRARARKKRAAG